MFSGLRSQPCKILSMTSLSLAREINTPSFFRQFSTSSAISTEPCLVPIDQGSFRSDFRAISRFFEADWRRNQSLFPSILSPNQRPYPGHLFKGTRVRNATHDVVESFMFLSSADRDCVEKHEPPFSSRQLSEDYQSYENTDRARSPYCGRSRVAYWQPFV